MKQKGFTLIELVIVIIVLGILAATAVPRFINLQLDAKNAALEGLKGAIADAVELSYSKLAIEGLEKEDIFILPGVPNSFPSVEKWCSSCLFTYGYPGSSPMTFESILDHVLLRTSELSDFEASFEVGNSADNSSPSTRGIYFSFPGNFNTATGVGNIITVTNCYVRYIPPTVTEQTYALELVPCE